VNGFVPSRAVSIARKEIRHILRDPFTLTLALGLPLAMVVFFGYAIDFDVREIRVAVADADASPASREVARAFSASNYFIVKPAPAAATLSLLDAEKAKAVLFIKPDFETRLGRGEPAVLQIVLDGADNQTTGVIASYLAGIQRALIERLAPDGRAAPVRLETRFLYNPELNSRWFIVPGLTVVVIGILSILLTALTIAREWERGSMELLLSTPARPLEIIIGKIAPYTILGVLAATFVYAAARLVFGIPFLGSHLVFLGATLLFLMAAMSQGVVISVVTRQQQLAMQMANISGMLPALLLSGFIFPVESMPAFFQKFTGILAPRWFMLIARGLFLKGAGPAELALPFIALGAIGTGLVALAVKKFKTDLEP
jgi:ABC-2 type transport system permease protein